MNTLNLIKFDFSLVMKWAQVSIHGIVCFQFKDCYEQCGGHLSTCGRYEIFVNDFINSKCLCFLCCYVLLCMEIKILFWSILKLSFL